MDYQWIRGSKTFGDTSSCVIQQRFWDSRACKLETRPQFLFKKHLNNTQAIRTLQNIVTGGEAHRALVLSSPPLLNLLRTSLTHSKVSVRRASAGCICQLLLLRPIRHREMRDAQIEQALKSVIGGRGHVRTASLSSGPNLDAAMAALASTKKLGSKIASPPIPVSIAGNSFSAEESPGLMGKEVDREVLESVRLALVLFEEGKESEPAI